MPTEIVKKLHELSIQDIEKYFGAKSVNGSLSKSGEKYFLTVDRHKIEVDKCRLISSDPIDKIATDSGVEVQAILAADKNPLYILFKKQFILCYVPVPDVVKVIDVKVRETIVNNMIIEGHLPANVGKQLLNSIK